MEARGCLFWHAVSRDENLPLQNASQFMFTPTSLGTLLLSVQYKSPMGIFPLLNCTWQAHSANAQKVAASTEGLATHNFLVRDFVISIVISWFLQWFRITVILDFYSHSPQNGMISLHSYDFTTDFWFQWFHYRFLSDFRDFYRFLALARVHGWG